MSERDTSHRTWSLCGGRSAPPTYSDVFTKLGLSGLPATRLATGTSCSAIKPVSRSLSIAQRFLPSLKCFCSHEEH
jgi:hypothetical protein